MRSAPVLPFGLLALGLLPLLLGACGNGAAGDTCGRPGEERGCVEGAICTPARAESVEPGAPNDLRSFCRTICDTNAECAGDGEGFTCRRVEGSMLSSCQPPDSDL